MPEVTLYIAVSADGYIARADGGIDWLRPYETGDYGYRAFYDSVQALVMGRKTYEQALSFGEWPYPDKPSYVYTRRLQTSPRPDVLFTRDPPATLLARLQAQGVTRVWLVGGGDLIATFRASQRIDEYWLFVIPLLLGDGIPLFGTGPAEDLALVETQAFPTGVTLLRYRRKLSDGSGEIPPA